MARQQSLADGPPRLKAVHRIEGDRGFVEPGGFFYPPNPEELKRLLELGAATLAVEEPAEGVIG